jgi:hypothetical protein
MIVGAKTSITVFRNPAVQEGADRPPYFLRYGRRVYKVYKGLTQDTLRGKSWFRPKSPGPRKNLIF